MINDNLETAMGVKINALDMQDGKNMEYINGIKTMCKIIVDRSFSLLHPIFYMLTINYYREKRALKVIFSFSLIFCTKIWLT